MKPLILVVDDEPDVEVSVSPAVSADLRAERFAMEFAQSAPMALQRICDAVVSLILILSDINMPGMSGLNYSPRRRRSGQTCRSSWSPPTAMRRPGARRWRTALKHC